MNSWIWALTGAGAVVAAFFVVCVVVGIRDIRDGTELTREDVVRRKEERRKAYEVEKAGLQQELAKKAAVERETLRSTFRRDFRKGRTRN